MFVIDTQDKLATVCALFFVLGWAACWLILVPK